VFVFFPFIFKTVQVPNVAISLGKIYADRQTILWIICHLIFVILVNFFSLIDILVHVYQILCKISYEMTSNILFFCDDNGLKCRYKCIS
jgi:hypothetical protein